MSNDGKLAHVLRLTSKLVGLAITSGRYIAVSKQSYVAILSADGKMQA